MLSNKYIYATILAISFFFSACELFVKSNDKARNIICLVDYSSSKNSAERLQFYKEVIRDHIIPGLGDKDKIIVVPIDKSSVLNATEIFIADLSMEDFVPDMASPMEESEIIQQNINRYKDSLTVVFNTVFQKSINDRNPLNMGTDLLGALENAKKYATPKRENYLVLLSDMMHYTIELKMEPINPSLKANNIDDLVAKTTALQMSDTRVLVITGELVEISAEHFNLVKSFWEKYFEKSEIPIIDYSSKSVSKIRDMFK